MNTEVINDLAQKFMNGTATAEEKALLHDWYALELKADEEVVVIVGNEGDQEEMKRMLYASVMRRLEVDEVNEMVMGDEKGLRRMQLRPNGWFRYGVGIAAALAIVVFGIWFFYASRHPDAGQDSGSAQYATDIKPGANRATLTLANGKTIVLSEAKAGVVIGDDNFAYDDGSEVQYSSGTQSSGSLKDEHMTTGPVGVSSLQGAERNEQRGDDQSGNEQMGKSGVGTGQMLTARTPKGGTYKVILPDGTNVWLNADSKLSFPSRFGAKERVVSLQGEAYFEVERDEKRPFTVKSPGQSVKVLGTHFNIYAYRNEVNIKTTLLEGSVDVNGTILRPNQQAILDASEEIKVREVNPNDVIDWKRGDFVFRGESLDNVMRRVSRWYDVEVSYASEDLKSITVGGFVSRSRSISAVLELMERTGKLTFKIEGRKVFVSK